MTPTIDDLRAVLEHYRDLPPPPQPRRRRARPLLSLVSACGITLASLGAAGPMLAAWSGRHPETLSALDAMRVLRESGDYTLRRTALEIARRRVSATLEQMRDAGRLDPGLADDVDRVLEEIALQARIRR